MEKSGNATGCTTEVLVLFPHFKMQQTCVNCEWIKCKPVFNGNVCDPEKTM